MGKKDKQQKNKFARPWLKASLWILLTLVLANVFSSAGAALSGSENTVTVASILAAFAALLLFYLSFRKSGFRGFFGGNRKLGWLLVLPVAVYALITLVFASKAPTLELFLFAMEAGVLEETLFRALPIALLVRARNFEEDRMPGIIIVTSVAFGLLHITNYFSGAPLGVSVYQAALCVCTGVFLGAAYLRSGNILPMMSVHFLQDIIAFLNTTSNTDGLMNRISLTPDVIFDIVTAPVILAFGIRYMRREKRADAVRVWKQIWSAEE